MPRRILIIDKNRIKSASLAPEELRPDDFQLIEELDGKRKVVAPKGLEIMDLSVSEEQIRKVSRSLKLGESKSVGKGLVAFGDNTKGEAVDVEVAHQIDVNECLRRFDDSKDRIHATPSILEVISNGLQAASALGFGRSTIYLPDEDGTLSRLEVMGDEPGQKLLWAPMEPDETMLSSGVIKQGKEEIVYQNDGEDLGEFLIDDELIAKCFGEKKPFLIVPIKHDEIILGSIVAESDNNIQDWQVERLKNLGNAISLNMWQESRREDSLIKTLKNRWAFAKYGNRQISRALSGQEIKPVSTLMIDVDNLHGFNARYGHEAGSRYMDSLGTMVTSELNAINKERAVAGPMPQLKAFSWAEGDEIVAIGMLSKSDAIEVAERIRSAVESRAEGPKTKEDEALMEEMVKITESEEPKSAPEEMWRKWWRTVSIGVSTFPDDLPMELASVQDKDIRQISTDDIVSVRKGLRLEADKTLIRMKANDNRNSVGTRGKVQIEGE